MKERMNVWTRTTEDWELGTGTVDHVQLLYIYGILWYLSW